MQFPPPRNSRQRDGRRFLFDQDLFTFIEKGNSEGRKVAMELVRSAVYLLSSSEVTVYLLSTVFFLKY